MPSAAAGGSYPHHLAERDAPPPQPVSARVLQMAKESARRSAFTIEHDDDARVAATLESRGAAAVNWRLAGSIAVLGDEANSANPSRDKASDGTVGDLRHQANWTGSDHNPWIVVAGRGVVRARDLDTDGLDLPAAFERARQLASSGHLPQVRNGGYLILNGRITAPDFSGWRNYTGPDPHVNHGHVSVSTEPDRFDDRRPWGIFAAAAPAPLPPAPAPTGWTGPDLTGSALGLRGDQGNNGPRVAVLQAWLARVYPAYAKGLAPDGWWGPKTTAVLLQFAIRSRVTGADGRNIGPQIARRLYLSGFRG